jgi:hypothetical protein
VRERIRIIPRPRAGVPAGRGYRFRWIAVALAISTVAGHVTGSAIAEPLRSISEGEPAQPVGWRDRIGVSLSAVATAPLEPLDFASAWGVSQGVGVELQWRASPHRSVVLEYTHDEFPFDARGYFESKVIILSVEGTDAHTDTWLLGLRAHHDSGSVRAGATLYAGKRSRKGQRAHVVYTQGEYDIGEKDDALFAYGFGVRLAGSLRGLLPDPFLEARGLWFADGQVVLPIRAGVSIP